MSKALFNLQNCIDGKCKECQNGKLHFPQCRNDIMKSAAEQLAEYEENGAVVHGRWEDTKGNIFNGYRARCSRCRNHTEFSTISPDFCPNCGAKMDGKESAHD